MAGRLRVVDYAAIAAIVGGTLGILYSPFHGAAYLATEGQSSPLIPWDTHFRDAFPAAFDFDTPHDVYIAYGHLALFPVLGLLGGVVALHRRQKHLLGPSSRFAYPILAGALIALTVGSVGEYYTPYLNEAFLISGPATLLIIGSSVWYGVLTLKAKVVPRVPAWLLVVGGPAVFPLIALLGHIPLAFLVLYLAWIWIGWFLVVTRPVHAAKPVAVAASD